MQLLFDEGASNKAIDGLGWGALTNDKQTKAVPNTFTPYKLLPRTVAYYHFLGPLKGRFPSIVRPSTVAVVRRCKSCCKLGCRLWQLDAEVRVYAHVYSQVYS